MLFSWASWIYWLYYLQITTSAVQYVPWIYTHWTSERERKKAQEKCSWFTGRERKNKTQLWFLKVPTPYFIIWYLSTVLLRAFLGVLFSVPVPMQTPTPLKADPNIEPPHLFSFRLEPKVGGFFRPEASQNHIASSSSVSEVDKVSICFSALCLCSNPSPYL